MQFTKYDRLLPCLTEQPQDIVEFPISAITHRLRSQRVISIITVDVG